MDAWMFSIIEKTEGIFVYVCLSSKKKCFDRLFVYIYGGYKSFISNDRNCTRIDFLNCNIRFLFLKIYFSILYRVLYS